MKKLVIMAVSLLTINATSFAGDGSETKPPVVIKAEAAFQDIVLNNGIDLVLTEGTENHIEIRGDERDVKNVMYSIKKGTLYVSLKNVSSSRKPVLYVSVSNLRSLEVNGKSKISSAGFLNSSELKVQINDEANFDLKNYGKILFEADEEINLHFEEYTGKL